MTRARLRCALYTRKSTEEGLHQDFNTLDAQREACVAYVKSQTSLGWRVIPTRYDDGGYSGGSMKRPALARLLGDIETGRIDVVVVYKIDRLTRALPDFARMVELFERHEVSFVSVTQAFNTTSSMGRLTLNVLLSFAQFEREVTGERIRDKIAASKKKGLWMGGNPPLGYDLPGGTSRKLRINAAEAETVRLIFQQYLDLGSVHALQRWLDTQGIRSKQRCSRSGRILGGAPFSRGALFHMLRNRIYRGEIVHKGEAWPGLHEAIIDQDLFEAVQAHLDGNTRRRFEGGPSSQGAELTGRIFDADGHVMSPTSAIGKLGKRYRYYVSAPLQQGRSLPTDARTLRRVPAETLEAVLRDTLRRLLPQEPTVGLESLTRIDVFAEHLEILLPLRYLRAILYRLHDGEAAEKDLTRKDQMRLTLPVRLQRRGGRTTVIGGVPHTRTPDPRMVTALRTAHAMVAWDVTGMPGIAQAPATSHGRRLIQLALLAPAIQVAILSGHHPQGLTLARLMRDPIPACWKAQARTFGFEMGNDATIP